jgi:pyruvate ferredoxin oxidoreductase gamma subunit
LTNAIYEIRWHGRGGQGAVTAARIVAEAAFLKGYPGVTATPSFGAERRGIPVSAATRISKSPILVVSQVAEPDLVVVLDQTLIAYKEVTYGLKKGGWLIINSNRDARDLEFNERFSIATTDATSVCYGLGLIVAGQTLINVAIIGALLRVTKLIDFENVRQVLKGRFNGLVLDTNLMAINAIYTVTRVKKIK